MPPNPSNPAPGCGIYILANDCVLEYAKALFRSLRHYNAEIPAFVLPFDAQIDAIAKEAEAFNIGMIHPPHLEDLDALAAEQFGEKELSRQMYRKFATFWGPLETFLYLDADIALLDDPAKMLNEFQTAGCDFLSFDNDETRAYEPGPLREKMQREYGSKSFNAGAFISRRGALDFERVRQLAQEAQPFKAQFAPGLGDQPFLNFAIDKSRMCQRRMPEINKNYPDKQWGDQTPIAWKEGAFRLLDKTSADYGKAFPFIHWAGHWQLENFPNRHIFYQFRLLDASLLGSIQYRLADRWRWDSEPLRNAWGWLRHKFRRLLQKLGIH
ncbi:MAG: hypothetical protein WCO68_08635 [Verrucomicrobiota bacterium]